MAKRQQRIHFDVALCSGEDDAHPAAELHQHTADAQGWQSPKFSEYPQELVLRLKGDTYMEHIQFLSDSCKIASKIEVFIAEPTAESSARLQYYPPEQAVWKRLGYFSLAPNETSDYIARQLKVVHVRCVALYLRLVFHKCHVNAYNFYNQVGLVALNVIGKAGPLYSQSPTPYQRDHGLHPSEENTEEVDLANMKPPDMSEGQGETQRHALQFDPITQRKIKELSDQKQRAVQGEDYDLAKRLRDQVENLRTVGSKLLLLENQKKQAVQREDYDLAKSLKQQIDALRMNALGVGRAQSPPQTTPPLCLPPMQSTPNSSHLGQQAHRGPQPLPPLQGEPAPEDQAAEAHPDEQAEKAKERERMAAAAVAVAAHDPNVPVDERPAVSRAYLSHIPEDAAEDPEKDLDSSKKWWDVDQVVNTENPFNTQGDVPGGGGAHARGGAAGDEAAGGLADWERDLKDRVVAQWAEAAHVEPLPEAKRRAASDMISGLGGFATKCLFSRKWQARDALIRSLAGKISAGTGDPVPLPDSTECTVLLFRHIVSKGSGLNDPVAGVQLGSMEATRMLLQGTLPHAVQPSLHQVALALVVKAADSNQRTREMATEILMILAVSPVYGAEKVCSIILHEPEKKPAKANASQWRPLHARVTLLSLLLDKFGLNKKELRSVLTVDAIMTKLALPAVNHTNPEAREAGIKLMAQLYKLGAQRAVEKHTKDLKKALKDVIDKECENAANPATNLMPNEREMMNSSVSIDGDDQVKEKIRAARAAASPMQTPAAAPQQAELEEEADENRCSFCKLYDERLDEEAMLLHQLHTCPMLCACNLCEMVFEVSQLNEHWVTDHQDAMKQCHTCLMAVRVEEYEDHLKQRSCTEAHPTYSLCVLCTEKISPSDDAWGDHLLGNCKNNPRIHPNPNPVEFQGR